MYQLPVIFMWEAIVFPDIAICQSFKTDEEMVSVKPGKYNAMNFSN
jgi:hypothetical protein